MDSLVLLALAAGLLQGVGYTLYLNNPSIEPEPTTWLMWGSSTWIIAALEAHVMVHHGEVHLALLVLPVVCGFMAGVVAYRCFRRGTIRWPEEWQDRLALILGMGLTFGAYIPGFLAVEYGWISGEAHAYMAVSVLIILNVITIVEFSPLIRNTWRKPEDEHPLPWGVWSVAYAMLFVSTVLEVGWSTLLIYPALNAALHGSIGLAALPIRRKRRRWAQPAE